MKYQYKGKKGITDLTSEKAFIGNSQGDETATNEISHFIASEGWLSNVFKDVDITDQQAIYAESLRRKQANIDYINSLKSEGEYGEEYTMDIEVIDNLMMDNNRLSSDSVESFSFDIIDFSKI